jgi:hypothetical protein
VTLTVLEAVVQHAGIDGQAESVAVRNVDDVGTRAAPCVSAAVMDRAQNFSGLVRIRLL